MKWDEHSGLSSGRRAGAQVWRGAPESDDLGLPGFQDNEVRGVVGGLGGESGF